MYIFKVGIFEDCYFFRDEIFDSKSIRKQKMINPFKTFIKLRNKT